MDNIGSMTKVSTLFNPKFILFNVEAENSEDLLKKLSEILFNEGYVKESFQQAVIEREKVFPTGLPTQGIKVALPHTDPEHVKKGVILVANLKKSIAFKEMGNGINDVPVELVFMLAIDQPKNQVVVLKSLMEIFTKADVLLALKNSKNVASTMSILEKEIK